MKKISVICIDCEPNYIDEVLLGQTYRNLEVVEAVTGKDFYEDIAMYCAETDSDYICFLEPGQRLEADKIIKMTEYAEKFPEAAAILCCRNYIEGDGTIVAHPDACYQDSFADTLFDGGQFLRACAALGHNLFGNLTTTMFRREKVTLNADKLMQYGTEDIPQLQKAFLLFEIIADRVLAVFDKPLVSTLVEKADMEKLRVWEELFESRMKMFYEAHEWETPEISLKGIAAEHIQLFKEENAKDLQLKKDITFFAMNKGEYYNLLPVMECAKKRGYQVKYSDNLDEKAEIGVYCQHVGKPENAKFSVILLHDMGQGHNRWPNIWELERWNVYDIGIVPGEEWADRWKKCAFQYYVNPRRGAYMLGYPKSNQVFSQEIRERAAELRERMQLQYDVSVLYAPSWECANKEDDFVRALASLPVNLLVKQGPWARGFGDTIVNNVNNMRKLHEGKYDNLHYYEWDENILVPLMMCDLVVSDESSVLMEALMFGRPSIAVEDWLIPDTRPARFACVPFKSVYKCEKAGLRKLVEQLLAGGLENAGKVREAEGFFVNKERVNEDIIDAIEYYTTGNGSEEFKRWRMSGFYLPANLWT